MDITITNSLLEEHFKFKKALSVNNLITKIINRKSYNPINGDVDNFLNDFYNDLYKSNISKKYLNNHLKLSIIDVEDFKNNNPFLKNIVIKQEKIGDCEYKYVSRKPYLTIKTFPPMEKNYSKDFDICITNKAYMCPICLADNGNFTWMSITPSEVYTMEKSISKMYGNTLVLGGGLGYFAYMASLNNNVTNVDVIEVNNNIAKYLKKEFLPQSNGKINIIVDDAFNYLKNNYKKYDSIFCDIWINDKDGLTFYMDLLKYEFKNPNLNIEYWIEDAILYYAYQIIYFRLCLEIVDSCSSWYSYNCIFPSKFTSAIEESNYKIKDASSLKNVFTKKGLIELLKDYIINS